MNVAAIEFVAERKMSLSILEELLARGNHIRSESILLAVKNDSLSVISQVRLGIMAFVLNFRHGLHSCQEVFSNELHILMNIFLVSTDRLVLVLNDMVELIHILRQPVD